MFEVSPFICHV